MTPIRGPPDGATTRWERMRLLLLQMQALRGMGLQELHRFLGGHFGLKKQTRSEYLEDLKTMGFITTKNLKLHVTKTAQNHFKLEE